MPLPAGTKLGPYQIAGAIGAGGMSEVYRAQDTRLGREVAVKVLPASFASDPERLRRFEQEARAVAALNHPNILAVYDIGTHDGAPFLVTELLEDVREIEPANRAGVVGITCISFSDHEKAYAYSFLRIFSRLAIAEDLK